MLSCDNDKQMRKIRSQSKIGVYEKPNQRKKEKAGGRW